MSNFLEGGKSPTQTKKKTSTFLYIYPVNFFKYLSLFLRLSKKEKEGKECRRESFPESRVLDEEKALQFPFFICVS